MVGIFKLKVNVLYAVKLNIGGENETVYNIVLSAGVASVIGLI